MIDRSTTSMTLGGLSCVVVGDGPPDAGRSAVVLLHGFGAPGDDLVPLGQSLEAPAGTLFVVPAAPHDLDPHLEALAWWPIDTDRIDELLHEGMYLDLRDAEPNGLEAARAMAVAVLDDVERKLGIPGARTVIGGFSQGAMLACDVALRTDRPLAGLALLSGSLLAARTWRPGMTARAGLPVLISHGALDPLLSYTVAQQLRDELTQAGADVTWVGFQGGHEVPPLVLENLSGFLRAVLPEPEPQNEVSTPADAPAPAGPATAPTKATGDGDAP